MDVPLQTTFYYDDDENAEYKVEEFVNCIERWYFIKWKGYPDSKNLWVFLEDLMNCEDKLEEYWKTWIKEWLLKINQEQKYFHHIVKQKNC